MKKLVLSVLLLSSFLQQLYSERYVKMVVSRTTSLELGTGSLLISMMNIPIWG